MSNVHDLNELAGQGRVVDLVLEGGGVKGIALLGAVLTLYEDGYRFGRIAGTSAGAIVASLVGAYQRDGRDLHELTDVMYGVPYAEFAGGTALQQTTGLLGDAVELVLHEGMHRTDCLSDWLRPILHARNVDTFADLAITDDGGSLQPYQMYSLVVHASDLSRRALVRLPWDYQEYGMNAATQSVVDAVRASMSIPFYFRPVQVPTASGKVTWVDGGLLSNFPITVFDRVDATPPRWPTWGIKLSSAPTQTPDHAVGNALSMAVRCMETLSSDWNHYQLDDEGVNQRTIFVDTSGYSATDFGLDKAAQTDLLTRGRAAAKLFLTRRPTNEQWPGWQATSLV